MSPFDADDAQHVIHGFSWSIGRSRRPSGRCLTPGERRARRRDAAQSLTSHQSVRACSSGVIPVTPRKRKGVAAQSCKNLIAVNLFASSAVIRSRLVPSPDALVAFRVPKICERCRTLGCVGLQHTVRGDRVQLQWRCATCEAEWPVKHRDQHVATTHCPFCGSNRAFNYASDHGVNRFRCSKCDKYWAATASTQ